MTDENKQSVGAANPQGEGTETKTEPEQKEKEKGSEKKYTDEDVNRIIDRKFEKWMRQQEEKLEEERNKAKMTEEQKTSYEMSKKDKQISELTSKIERMRLSDRARAELSKKGYTASDEILSFVVRDNDENTDKAIEASHALIEKTVMVEAFNMRGFKKYIGNVTDKDGIKLYEKINRFLWDSYDPEDAEKEIIVRNAKNIFVALELNKNKHDLVAYRYQMPGYSMEGEYKGFLSTSLSNTAVMGNNEPNSAIIIPKHIKTAYLDLISEFDQRELLVRANTKLELFATNKKDGIMLYIARE